MWVDISKYLEQYAGLSSECFYELYGICAKLQGLTLCLCGSTGVSSFCFLSDYNQHWRARSGKKNLKKYLGIFKICLEVCLNELSFVYNWFTYLAFT